MKPIRWASIKSGRPEDDGARIALGLFRDTDAFRWYGGEPGEDPKPVREQDTEVSARTVTRAVAAARTAWASLNWDFQLKEQ